MNFQVLLFFLLVLPMNMVWGQGGCIRGIVIDEASKKLLPFATVQVFFEGKFLQSDLTDLEGKFEACELPEGELVDMQIDYTGYSTLRLTSVPVGVDSIIVALNKGGHICAINVISICIPIVQHDDLTSGQIFTADQIRRQPSGRNYAGCAVCREINRKASREARREKRRLRKAMPKPGNSGFFNNKSIGKVKRRSI